MIVRTGTPTYEFILTQFRTQSGLYLIGAGASTGVTPRGPLFMTQPATDFVSKAGSYPVQPPQQSELNQKIIRLTRPQLARASADYPYLELLDRLPSYSTRLTLKHQLAKARFEGRTSDNYEVFRHFAPSMLLTFNLDGLVADQCGRHHRIVDAHGTVPVGYGSAQIAKLAEELREYDLAVPPDDLLLCVPELHGDTRLADGLSIAERSRPDFIALIGYSFARDGETFDDHISLRRLGRAHRGFNGNVYVIDPYPDNMRDMVAECIGSNKVFAVPQFWNVLAHAFRGWLTGRCGERSLNYDCERILDLFGSEVAFPRIRDLS